MRSDDQMLGPRTELGFDDLRTERLELYALDLLSDDEAAEVEASLASDPQAQALVRELRGTLATLSLELEPVTPSDGLRNRLLAAVAAESDVAAHTAPYVPLAPRTPSATPSTAPVRLDTERARRRGLPTWSSWAVAAALAIALVGSMLWNAQLRQDLDERIATQTYPVAGSGPAESVSGSLTELIGRGEMVLVLNDLPALEPGRVYQVWLIADGPPIPSIVFSTDASGVTRILVPEAPEGYQLLAITEEPSGGSAAPTTDPFISSPLTN